MILLFTDFSVRGPYLGQMKAVLADAAPNVPAVDLMHDAPAFNPRASAYLLGALATEFPAGSVFLCVIDPGVGTQRRPVAVRSDGRWFVGPDNGLFHVVSARARKPLWFEIDWEPNRMSDTFHGRDLFAPVAARLGRGEDPPGHPIDHPHTDTSAWPADLAEIIYVDGYGNAWTGLRAGRIPDNASLAAEDQSFRPARTFGDAPPGTPIWYVNSSGLAELAITQGNAAERHNLRIGCPVRILNGD